jgi:hypothetical protein
MERFLGTITRYYLFLMLYVLVSSVVMFGLLPGNYDYVLLRSLPGIFVLLLSIMSVAVVAVGWVAIARRIRFSEFSMVMFVIAHFPTLILAFGLLFFLLNGF